MIGNRQLHLKTANNQEQTFQSLLVVKSFSRLNPHIRVQTQTTYKTQSPQTLAVDRLVNVCTCSRITLLAIRRKTPDSGTSYVRVEYQSISASWYYSTVSAMVGSAEIEGTSRDRTTKSKTILSAWSHGLILVLLDPVCLQ